MTAKLIDRKTILRFLGLFGAVASLVTSCCLTVDGLSEPALRTLGVLIAALFLLIFETFNVCVSCMLSCAMLFATGCVDTIAGAFSGFTNHIIYFTTASFGISLAFQKSALSRLFLRMVMGKKKRRVLPLSRQFSTGLAACRNPVGSMVTLSWSIVTVAPKALRQSMLARISSL